MNQSDATILIVDDEINNIRLLQADLEDAGYQHILVARDGVEAWDILTEKHAEIDVVLLDRMMPNMDGMEVLANIRAHSDMRHIPIIMQTAAASKDQMLEGIKAGVYYYLTKPYDEETLLTIVSAALRDYRSFMNLQNESKANEPSSYLLDKGHFSIRTLEDVTYLSGFLANMFPHPEQAYTGIFELLLNAIEHGLLGISYLGKSELILEDLWKEEIERRLALPENQNKFVQVAFTRDEEKISLQIKDYGAGFKWEPFLDISPERATHSHGRGIAMARMLSFDDLTYVGNGNEVHCMVHVHSND